MHPDWENEIKRLDIIKQVIGDELIRRAANAEEYKKRMRMINKEMWEEAGALSGHSTFDEAPSFLQGMEILKQNMRETSENDKKVKMLEKQLDTPYFGRIDFREDNCGKENIYIGIYGFRKSDTGEILIYDWRAPVSSMFYDYETGRALYESPSGNIEGELVLKRQYRIEKGRLLFMFDSNVAIEDNILQDILGGSAGNRMKTIVSTIQRQQNRAIRYEGKRVMAVQGPAGSGKTSIALHRAAYLLYHHRNTLKAENILLFTPNGAFSEYISTVLPNLGEEDLNSVTLAGLAQDTLGDLFNKYESYSEMMEWQLSQDYTGRLESRLEGIRFKASKQFTIVLESFAKELEKRIMRFDEIRSKDTVFATREELEALFHHSYRHMPLAKRLSRMKLLVTTRVREYENLRQQELSKEITDNPEYLDAAEIRALSRLRTVRELEIVFSNMESMLSIDTGKIYRMLFEDTAIWNSCGGILSDKARRLSVEALSNGILYFEDQASILYLLVLTGMIDPDRDIRHLIIDEAQDYTNTAFKLFSLLYSQSTITLLGDVNQNISPASGIKSIRSAGEAIDPENSIYFELDKSYRSTQEIMAFASRIIPSGATPFGRNGKAPEIVTAATVKDLCHLIEKHVRDINEEKYHSIAVICRTLSGCRRVYENIGNDLPAELVTNGDDEIPPGVVVLPSYLAKGLEFDVVAAVVLSAEEYVTDEDQLFYTVCTRALHRLDIFAVEGAGLVEKLLVPDT